MCAAGSEAKFVAPVDVAALPTVSFFASAAVLVLVVVVVVAVVVVEAVVAVGVVVAVVATAAVVVVAAAVVAVVAVIEQKPSALASYLVAIEPLRVHLKHCLRLPLFLEILY